jgi:serine-type D-Ala-D-Ala carboxypeptidase/endopeptidase (penicillin-binding protein 4)
MSDSSAAGRISQCVLEPGMMRSTRLLSTAVLFSLSLASSVFAGIREDVDRLIRLTQLKGATVAVSVRDCGTGAAMVTVNQDAPMAPASNMKLLTTGAALHALGADFEFATKLVRDGNRLIVVGDGDPAFADPELLPEMSLNGSQGVDVDSFIDLWVKAAANSGVSSWDEITIDDRIFDREFIHQSWPADQLNKRYCAQVAGFNFHGNVLHFFPRPRKGETPDVSEVRPRAPWLKVANAGTSRDSSRDKNDAWVARKLNTNELTVRGNVRFAYKTPVPVTIHDVPDFFARLLADRINRAGIRVSRTGVCDRNGPATNGEVLGPIVTTPISTVITRCNTESENLYAECLLKRIGFAVTGEPGSWINGAAVMRHIVHKRLGDPQLAAGVIVADGSGLSAQNRVTAASMTAWLNSFHNDAKLGPVFIESLAVGGESGTLKSRLSDSNKLHGAVIQAKTGYINRVSCLSGYVTMSDGRRRAFSVLVNNLPSGSVSVAKKLQDQIVAAIAEDMATSTVTLGSD